MFRFIEKLLHPTDNINHVAVQLKTADLPMLDQPYITQIKFHDGAPGYLRLLGRKGARLVVGINIRMLLDRYHQLQYMCYLQ